MKKFTFIIAILLVLILGIASQKTIENKTPNIPLEDVLIEEDLQLEDWMTTPFLDKTT